METTENLPKKITAPLARNHYESEAWASGDHIAGIDEVGRGCTAGPVVAAAVLLYPRVDHPLLRDSKTLTRPQREEAAIWIRRHSWQGIGIVASHDIDSLNIYQATQVAMRRALAQLWAIIPEKPSKILVDAMPLTNTPNSSQVLYFIKGEQKSTSIAAASIIAKVYRDRLMEELAHSFPNYTLESHKGYATELHRKALVQQGMSIIHRSTFIDLSDYHAQATLFC